MSNTYPPYSDYVKQQQTVQLPSDVASVLARVFEEHRMMMGTLKMMNERMAHLEWFTQNFESRLHSLESGRPIVPYSSAPRESAQPYQGNQPQQYYQNGQQGYY